MPFFNFCWFIIIIPILFIVELSIIMTPHYNVLFPWYLDHCVKKNNDTVQKNILAT